jgi:Peptidase family M48
MQAVTVQELKAILAHEFGHYHSGDVKIGPWIHKTRAAIGRTIEKRSDSCLQKVFVAYGNLFLRVTHAISRRQEFIADEVAANAAGAAVMASALRKAHEYAAAFNGYWSAWDDVVETVFVPIWRAQVKGNDRLLAGITSPARLPFAGRLTVIAGQFDAAEQPVLDQVQVVTMALSLALLDAGWRGTTSPGEEIVFRHNELEVRPFDELMAVAAGQVSAEQWAARCAELGIERVVLRAGRS